MDSETISSFSSPISSTTQSSTVGDPLKMSFMKKSESVLEMVKCEEVQNDQAEHEEHEMDGEPNNSYIADPDDHGSRTLRELSNEHNTIAVLELEPPKSFRTGIQRRPTNGFLKQKSIDDKKPKDNATSSRKSYKTKIIDWFSNLNKGTWVKVFLLLLYNAYFIAGIYLTWNKARNYGEGIKLFTVLTIIGYTSALYYWFLKYGILNPVVKWIRGKVLKPLDQSKFWRKNKNIIIWSIVIMLVTVYCIYITRGNHYRLVSGIGIICFICIGYLMSSDRAAIDWNQVLWGLSLQFALALIVLRTSVGKEIFKTIGNKVTTFLAFTDVGSKFMFGYLVTGELESSSEFKVPVQFGIFAFKVLPVILFFSFFVSILYYYGVMQVIVQKVGWLLQKTIGTTPCESLNAAANIFLGMTEAPLIIKPFLGLMTKSELFAVMTGGFATIAGSVLAAYINFGVNASHLISASVMAAPGALGISKLFQPETEISKTGSNNLSTNSGSEQNALEAAGNGASQAIKICSNIAANLIAFLAFIRFMDTIFIWFGSNVDLDYISFEWLLAKLFIPISLMMGVEWSDCDKVAKLIGLKTLVNEFVAYKELADMKTTNLLTERSQTISTYALCGFSNFASIGITLAALGTIVPERKSDLASIALRAMIAGSTTTFISACMAGLLVDDQIVISTMNSTIT